VSDKTAISWTDATFNPWWGCSRVSPGCLRCYAETHAARFAPGHWGKTGPRRLFGDAHWAEPLRWNRRAEQAGVPLKVFCASMADVFEDHEDLDAPRARLWELIEATPWLRWQLLTKRPENVIKMAPWDSVWPRQVWLGVSAEDQQRADERIPTLLDVPAAVRFVSAEPLIGPVRLRSAWVVPDAIVCGQRPRTSEASAAIAAVLRATLRRARADSGTTAPEWIDWLIIGGESGNGARPMDLTWAHDLARQARAAGIAVWVKQLGSAAARELGVRGKGEQLDDLPADLRIREFPADVNHEYLPGGQP
jgi:protein gp37